MKPESALNPYAAPQSDVTPRRTEEVPMGLPASTKWVLGLSVLISIAAVCYHTAQMAMSGLSTWASNFIVWPPMALGTLLLFLSYAVMTLRPRPGLAAYICGVLITLFFASQPWRQELRNTRSCRLQSPPG